MCIPIWKSTAYYIEKFIRMGSLCSDDHLFKNRRNENLTRSGVGQRVKVITSKAALICPSLKEKTITLHTFRHSTAMNLLQAGVDISTIVICFKKADLNIEVSFSLYLSLHAVEDTFLFKRCEESQDHYCVCLNLCLRRLT